MNTIFIPFLGVSLVLTSFQAEGPDSEGVENSSTWREDSDKAAVITGSTGIEKIMKCLRSSELVTTVLLALDVRRFPRLDVW